MLPERLQAELESPFYEEIISFKEKDQKHFPEPGQVLFVGSSSIRFWTGMKKDFETQVIKRGFGGAHLSHLVYYAKEIIVPYKPKKVFVYAGENDLAEEVSKEEVLQSFEKLENIARTELPQCKFYYISIKPSPCRKELWKEIQSVNKEIQKRCDQNSQFQMIGITKPMLGAEGVIREDIFLSDQLHMNRKGYDIWVEVIRPYVKG